MPALAGFYHHRGIPRWIEINSQENQFLRIVGSVGCLLSGSHKHHLFWSVYHVGLSYAHHGGDAVMPRSPDETSGWNPGDLHIFRTIQGSFMGCLKIRNGILHPNLLVFPTKEPVMKTWTPNKILQVFLNNSSAGIMDQFLKKKQIWCFLT